MFFSQNKFIFISIKIHDRVINNDIRKQTKIIDAAKILGHDTWHDPLITDGASDPDGEISMDASGIGCRRPTPRIYGIKSNINIC